MQVGKGARALPVYNVNLRAGYTQSVDVPASVKGVEAVAAYIANTLGQKYARGVHAKNIRGAAENWADSHYDFILDEIQRIANETRELAAK